MEKICEQCGNKYNAKNKKQKYCSVNCQHESYRKLKVERIECICLFCGNKFYDRQWRIDHGGGKYCTKKCSSDHKKITFLGDKNPSYNRKMSDNELKMRSEITKKLWENEDFKNKVRRGKLKFYQENGYWPGTDNDSKEKRKKTMIERYGVSHNWNGKYGERKCDITTLKYYGKMAADMLNEYSFYFGKKTDIEVIFENLLKELGIPNQPKFRIYDKNKEKFWFREYDFLLIGTNILIETDGDYWHGNTCIFTDLTDFQKQIKENDKIKENFANENGYEIVRFWGNDIKNNIEIIKDNLIKIWEKLD